jgi:hypothetical protein
MVHPQRVHRFPDDYAFSPEKGVLLRRQFGKRHCDLVPRPRERAALRMGDDRWTYPSVGDAIAALTRWDGEGDPPNGWIRHRPSGRRRPDGTAGSEYVAA